MGSVTEGARRLVARALLAATAISAVCGLALFPAPPRVLNGLHGALERGDSGHPGAGGSTAREAPAAAPASATGSDLEAPRDEPPEGSLLAHVRLHLAERMPGQGHAIRARVAETVVAESAHAGIDPLLVLAVIHVESMFDPDAVSARGAAGLMQLRGPTMREVLERAGLPPADPRDPVAGVQAGVRYLDHLLASFDGLDVALMAYNAGPGRIRGHLRSGNVPARYREYPERVRGELARLRLAFGTATPPAPVRVGGQRQG